MDIKSTYQRSESSNFYFGNYVQRGDTLSEFYICYQSAIEKQRNNAKKLTHYDDFTPKTITDREIEKDAIRLYTRDLFYKVQEEIRAGCMDIILLGMTCLDNVKKIKIQEPGKRTRIFEVLYFVFVNFYSNKYLLGLYNTDYNN